MTTEQNGADAPPAILPMTGPTPALTADRTVRARVDRGVTFTLAHLSALVLEAKSQGLGDSAVVTAEVRVRGSLRELAVHDHK